MRSVLSVLFLLAGMLASSLVNAAESSQSGDQVQTHEQVQTRTQKSDPAGNTEQVRSQNREMKSSGRIR